MFFHQSKITSFTKYKPTIEHKKKISVSMIGKKLSNETKKKISIQLRRDRAYQWKGDEASYSAKHKRIIKYFDRPKKCDFCGNIEYKQYDWANISGEYKDDISDWKRLCSKCHRGWDSSRRHGYEKKWLKFINQLK